VVHMTEPYLAHPVSPMEAAGMGLAAAAIPTISAIIISRIVNSFVEVIIPLDEKKERNKFYNHSQRIIKSSSLPSSSSTSQLRFDADELEDTTNYDTTNFDRSSSSQNDDEDLSKSGWMDHVERAKAELGAAQKKVRCAKCKKDIAEVNTDLETRMGEMVKNAKRHKTMIGLQDKGKIKPGKTWKQLTPNEKKMIKSMEN
jgi:hypothetical protein